MARKVPCKYHPGVPARWSCPSCAIDFCPGCARPRPGAASPPCPVCKQPLQSLGAANLITPFWARIPSFFAYPFQGQPLTFMIFCAVSAAVLMTLGPPVSFLALVVLLLFYKYAYAVLNDTAHGHLRARPQFGDALLTDLELPLKQVVIFLILAYLNFKVHRLFGAGPFYLSFAITYFLLPASIMVLAVENSMLRAINPLMLGMFIYRVGWSYLILWFFLFVLSTGMEVASGFLYENLPPIIFFLGYLLVSFYFIIVMFHMMGYAIYQHHEELGMSIEETQTMESFAKRHQEVVGEGPPEMAEVEVLIKEGKLPEARDRLLALTRDYPADLAAWRKLFRILVMLNDADTMRTAAKQFISRQFAENNIREAAACYLEAAKVAPDFRPASAEQRFELASYFSQGVEPRATVALLNNLHGDFPMFERIPEAYMLVARLLSERFNQDDKARAVLGFILKKYPHSAQAAEARDYLSLLDSLA